MTFEDALELLYFRLADESAVGTAGATHSFREVMADRAAELPDRFYWRAFETMGDRSHLAQGATECADGDSIGRLSHLGVAFARVLLSE